MPAEVFYVNLSIRSEACNNARAGVEDIKNLFVICFCKKIERHESGCMLRPIVGYLEAGARAPREYRPSGCRQSPKCYGAPCSGILFKPDVNRILFNIGILCLRETRKKRSHC